MIYEALYRTGDSMVQRKKNIEPILAPTLSLTSCVALAMVSAVAWLALIRESKQ